MIIAEVSITPLGVGTSVSKYVIKAAEEAEINAGAQRVSIFLKIDDRRDKDATVKAKLRSLGK